MVVYVESTRIEIPLAHSSVRGARGKFPVKLIYASVLPMILVRALQANIQMIGMFLYTTSASTGSARTAMAYPVSGLMFYINPIGGMPDWVPSLAAQAYPGIQLVADRPARVHRCVHPHRRRHPLRHLLGGDHGHGLVPRGQADPEERHADPRLPPERAGDREGRVALHPQGHGDRRRVRRRADADSQPVRRARALCPVPACCCA